MPSRPPAPIVRGENTSFLQARRSSTELRAPTHQSSSNFAKVRDSIIFGIIGTASIIAGATMLLAWGSAIGIAALAVTGDPQLPTILEHYAGTLNWLTIG